MMTEAIAESAAERTAVERSERAWAFWKQIGNPRFVVAPMVDQSELPFRMLTRRHGAELAYTPMLHARLYVEDESYREKHFKTHPEDWPVFAQFCGNDPQTIIAAARLIQSDVQAIDLNFGCPQGIARRGNYGSFLLQDKDRTENIVREVASGIDVPLAVKLRKLSKDNLQETVDFCKRLEAAGAAVICLHGRTKEEKTHAVSACDWEVIRLVKEAVSVPVIANGGVETREDALRCLQYTRADAVMSAEALLENPALFSGSLESRQLTQTTMALQYIQCCIVYGLESLRTVRPHIFRFLHSLLVAFPHLRASIIECMELEQYREVVERIALIHDHTPQVVPDSNSYYRRHRTPPTATSAGAATDDTPQKSAKAKRIGYDLRAEAAENVLSSFLAL